MEVVGHQTKSEEPHRHTRTRLPEQRDKGVVIVVVMKYPGPAIAAIKGMVAIAAHGGSRGSRHGAIVEGSTEASKRILSPPSSRPRNGLASEARARAGCRKVF